MAVPRLAPAYLGTVQLTACATRRLLSPAARERLLRRCSTNVDNLRAGHWDTLATSAFLVEEPMGPPYALLLLASLGHAERAHGARWTAGVFAGGHVGASLAVYGGLRVLGAGPHTRSAVDVGVSYGHHAVLGALAAALPRPRARAAVCAAALAFGARPLLGKDAGFTDAGHLTALALGMLLGPALGRGRRRGLRRPSSQ